MKKYRSGLWLILLLLLTATVRAADYDKMLQDAQQLYADGKYTEALELYHQIESNGKEAFGLYFNMGNAYFKLNNIPNAILYYERAKKLNANDEDLQHNLEIANQYTSDKFDKVPTLNVTKAWHSFLLGLGEAGWGSLSIICFVLCLFGVAMMFYSSRKGLKRLGLLLGIVMIGISITTFIFSSQAKSVLAGQAEGIIFEPTITVISSPDQQGRELFVLHEGTKVKILEQMDDWARIKISNGEVGWLPKNAVKAI